MTAMTIAQMRTQVRSIVDIDATDISDTVMDNILGQGYDLIVYSEKRWPFFETATTFNTVASQKDYTLAAVGASVTEGLREVAALRNDDHIIGFLGSDNADSNYPLNVTTSGSPWNWSYWNDTVRLYPTPDAVQTIYVRGLRDAAAFGTGVSDSTEPDLPDPFHAILVTYAIGKAYLQQEDPVMANQYQSQFIADLDNVARRYADVPAPQPMIANSRSSSRYLAGYGALRYANTGGIIW
jgi:hypothetical protein